MVINVIKDMIEENEKAKIRLNFILFHGFISAYVSVFFIPIQSLSIKYAVIPKRHRTQNNIIFNIKTILFTAVCLVFVFLPHL